MAALHEFERCVAAAWPPEGWLDVAVVVAVSGGADSTALLHALATLRNGQPGLVVAHYNHRLRGQESDDDEQFVGELSQRLGLPSEIGSAPSTLRTVECGREAAARRHRYRFLRAVADRWGARYVVTAHTADDQVETMLHRLVRGTGLRGLAGIPRTRAISPLTVVVRPLLGVTRAQVRLYLDELALPCREDSTNRLTRHTRNRIRHELLPVLRRDYNPAADAAVLRLGDLARQAQEVIDRLVESLISECLVHRSEDEVELRTHSLASQPRFIVREVLISLWRGQPWPLRAMDERKWQQLGQLVQTADTTRQVLTMPGNIEIVAIGDQLTCSRRRGTAGPPRGASSNLS
jgi:tRNA(Ile)-lysidine synthase